MNSVRILITVHFQVRFFSFLVGEEATDFEQVRWMACNNRGFMVHISNLADIQEKIQHYVRVLSQPISHQAGNINQESAVWSSIARERMVRSFYCGKVTYFYGLLRKKSSKKYKI